MKRIIGLLMAVVMVISICQINISTVNAETADVTVSWDADSATLTVSGTGDMPEYSVNTQPWVEYKQDAKKIVIEDGVTSVSEAAFYGFNYVTELEVAGTVKKINTAAFAQCTSLRNITLKNGVEELGEYVFEAVAAETINLPASLKTMDVPMVFFDIHSLQNIVIDSNNNYFCVQDGVIYNKSKTELLFYPATKQDTSFSVPATVKSIGANAMRDNNFLTEIILPASVTSLGDWCFYKCVSLENMNIPNTVTSVGSGILEGCSALTTVNVGSGIKSASYRMFTDCTSLTTVVFNKGVECIESRAFYNCPELTTVTLPESLTTIETYAFYNCTSLKTLMLPSSIATIASGAFAECNNLNVTLPDGMHQLEDGSYAKVATIKIEGNCNYNKAYEVLTIVNQERAKEGLEPLTMDKDLLEAAMKRAVETTVYFDHTRPNGTDCFTISNKANGENIAAGSSTAESVMNLWMNSSGHKANILTGSYKSIGIGCFVHGGMTYWVQLFGRGEAQSGTKPVNRDVIETVTIKEEYTDFELAEKIPSSIDAGDSVEIELRTVNKGWNVVYCEPTDDSFDWSSSNTSVATVGAKGKVTAVSAGQCVITAKFKGTNIVAFTQNITVKGELSNNSSGTSEQKIKKATIQSIKKTGAKKVKISIKKISKIKGYQIKYSTKKSFAKSKSKITRKTKVTIKKLKKGKRYYFKVRAYIVNDKENRVYGQYSKVKKVKM